MKRNRQYMTAPLFPRMFKGGGDLLWDRLASAHYGEKYGDEGFTLEDYKNSSGNNWFGISKKNNIFSRGNIGTTTNVLTGALAAPVGSIAENAISGGRESKAGNTISNVGGTIGSAISTVNPLVGAAVTVGSKMIGGTVNAAFGMKTNQQALQNANKSINYYNSFNSNAGSFDGIPTLEATSFTNPYKGGWFSKGKADAKNEALRNRYNEGKMLANRSITNNVNNIAGTNMNNYLANYSAFGGPLDVMSNPTGAIGYNFMSDYLNMKSQQANARNSTVGYLGSIPSDPMAFADGGGIHIAKSKEGTYKAAADRRGISMAELADRIKANPENYSPSLRRKANFYNNFARHRKSDGGNLIVGDNGDTLFALGGYKTNKEYDDNYYYPYGTDKAKAPRLFVGGGNTDGDDEGSSPIARVVPQEYSKAADVAWGTAEVVPVVGNILGVADVANDIYNMANTEHIGTGDLANLALDVAGLVPGAGIIAKAAKLLKTTGKAAKAVKATKAADKLDKAASKVENAAKKLAFTSTKGTQKIKEGVQKAYNYNREAMRQADRTAHDIATGVQPLVNFSVNSANKANEATRFTNGILRQVDNALSPQAVRYNNARITLNTADAVNDMFNLTNTVNSRGYGGPIDRRDTLFALGGDLQTNGTDWGTGLVHVDNGGLHEENPYSGVQMGLAPDGTPNLVEEDETIFDDYVFSNRIHPKKEVLKKFHMYSKGGKLTYADVSKRLEKEAKERPNDPISKASLKDMLTQLMEAQEQQKAEEEARKAKEAFDALSPEEQQAVLQQVAQQQAQENAPQEGNPQEEVPVDESGNPMEQQASMMQEMMQGDAGVIGAEGGRINRFDEGGDMIRQAILKAIRMKNGQRVLTQQMFNDWAKENNVTDFDYNGDWTKALQNESLKAALSKASPALIYAMANGYGMPYDASNSPILNTDQTKGNWKAYMPQAWKDSADAFMKELEWDKISGMSNKEFADAVKNTNAYKRTTEWLKDAANAKQYFNALLQDDNTPEEAKDWIRTKVFDSDNNWLGGKYDYDTMMKPVREDEYVGSFWKSAVPATVPDISKNLLVDKNGNISVIDNTDLSGLTKLGDPYKWRDGNGNNTYTFYSMPETNAQKVTDKEDKLLDYKEDKLRYAGLMGPMMGLGLWSAGVGKPDYAGLDAALDTAYGNVALADYKPIGDYMDYKPVDVWSQRNRNAANARATDRMLTNNSSPVGTRMSGLLANGYNSQLADANLLRQAEESNYARKAQAKEFNRGTNIQNANAYNQVSQFNANALNNQRQYASNLALQAAQARMNGDAQWNNALYGNIDNFFQGISDLGKENAQWNMIAAAANNGAFGSKGSEWDHYGGKKSKGGKLRKKKRGLTF